MQNTDFCTPSDLDTGQARIPGVAHQTQGAQQVIGLQIASPRSQCFSCYSTRHLQNIYRNRQYGDSMRSPETMLQPQQVTSNTTASGRSSVDQHVVDQFTQMRSMLSSFLRQSRRQQHVQWSVVFGCRV